MAQAPATTPIRIPFNRPCFAGSELNYISEAVMRRGHISGDGYFTKQCNAFLEREIGVHRALLTTNCTHALEMSALLLDIQPGDEVICPDFTFVSTINAFVLRGAMPVFVDVRSDTLNLDENLLEAAITPRTRAILVVHYGGVGAEMDTIMAIAAKHRIPVIEDNAHGLFAKYKGRNLGTFGVMATQSFHETKNFQCGEGGALLIADEQLAERAEIIREKGTNRSRFFRGQVDKYTWVDVGSSYLPSDVLAAFLWAQFEGKESIQSRRQRIWDRYDAELKGWADQHDVQLPTVPAYCDQAYHVFYMVLPNLQTRQNLIAHLRSRGILGVFHYLPLHLSDKGQEYGGQPGDCPVTERLGECLLRLPLFNDLSEAEQGDVLTAIHEFEGWV
jgi:dTDP-4-amino-4,6-dideoxygalactose transaminase